MIAMAAMEVDVDPFTTTVVGSRYPISVPASDAAPAQSKPISSRLSTAITPIIAIPTSTIRRKPVYTYKSPAALAASEHLFITRPASTAATPRAPSTIASDLESAKNAHAIAETRPKHTIKPSLPLYHPQGNLALSLPELDPGIFGLPSRLTVDDNEPVHEGDTTRRSSSRARRPAAKVRDRDRDMGGDDERPGSSGTNGRAADREATRDRPSSPRKRRAGGTSAAKRKRREPDDVDSGYPAPPPKRTRNPRGVAGATTPPVASPLASAMVVSAGADTDVKADVGTTLSPTQALDSVVPEEAQAEEQPGVETEPRRSTRPRRARAAANRRRPSDASETNSSASGSITANGTTNGNGHSAPKRPSRTRKAEPRGQDITPEKKEEEEADEEAAPVPTNATNGVEHTDGELVPPAAPTPAPAVATASTPASAPMLAPTPAPASDPVSVPAPIEEVEMPKAPNDDVVMAEAKPSPVVQELPPQKEEKEEGELSDEAETPMPVIKA
ncbi:hypothetical protein CERSUDRAFT_119105 [Gelatoporia subvermispora B]|uniref:Uncharacterized protein n=1 Tax=Ceriporiopsis subvermispora (strain B) TaxID=914234 RepID=M2P9K3_CERS8|nr:hypothetical protein CERSUDRAFT_119105 [Gelatoporia subvermispora B]